MKRLLTLATSLSIVLTIFAAPPASAFDAGDASCLTISSNVVTDGSACVGEITIPASVTSIGDFAFYGASALTSITIPAGVTSIRDFAFFGASALTSITIPSGVTSIGNYAFRNASALASFRFLGADAPSTSFGSFTFNAPNAKAIINSGATGFAASGQSWNGLTIEILSDAPTSEQLAANAREVARLAQIQREAEKKKARSELASGSSALLTLERFATAEVPGITAINLPAVSAEVAALVVEKRMDIAEVLKIARKYEVVDKIATNSKVYPKMLQEIGLIPLDSLNKSTLTATVLKLDPVDRSSFEKVQAVINIELKIIETRQKRMEEIRRRLGK